MTVDKSSTHPAVAEYLAAKAHRKQNSPEQIAKRHGMSKAYLYRLVSQFEQENGLEPTTTTRPEVTPLSETIGAHAVTMVPELGPDEQEAAGSAATQS